MRERSPFPALAAVPTMIAGIVAMNVDIVTELHWEFGNVAVNDLMLVITSVRCRAWTRSVRL